MPPQESLSQRLTAGREVVAPGRVELPTFGLGNRCSIHLSYGAACALSINQPIHKTASQVTKQQ
jgi:hypothetical protein